MRTIRPHSPEVHLPAAPCQIASAPVRNRALCARFGLAWPSWHTCLGAGRAAGGFVVLFWTSGPPVVVRTVIL